MIYALIFIKCSKSVKSGIGAKSGVTEGGGDGGGVLEQVEKQGSNLSFGFRYMVLHPCILPAQIFQNQIDNSNALLQAEEGEAEELGGALSKARASREVLRTDKGDKWNLS